MRPAIEILTQHGWSPDYRTDPTPHLENTQRLGFSINDESKDFFSKFGGLTIRHTIKSNLKTGLSTDVASLKWPNFTPGCYPIENYSLVGIGDNHRSETCLLFLPGDGLFHVDIYDSNMDDDFVFLNFFDALECIIGVYPFPWDNTKIWNPSNSIQISPRWFDDSGAPRGRLPDAP